MSENTRLVHATPQGVWDVLSDDWLYPLWVVGASRMREVDDVWPATGASCTTPSASGRCSSTTTPEVTAAVELQSLTLRARGWPTCGGSPTSPNVADHPRQCLSAPSWGTEQHGQ